MDVKTIPKISGYLGIISILYKGFNIIPLPIPYQVLTYRLFHVYHTRVHRNPKRSILLGQVDRVYSILPNVVEKPYTKNPCKQLPQMVFLLTRSILSNLARVHSALTTKIYQILFRLSLAVARLSRRVLFALASNQL